MEEQELKSHAMPWKIHVPQDFNTKSLPNFTEFPWSPALLSAILAPAALATSVSILSVPKGQKRQRCLPSKLSTLHMGFKTYETFHSGYMQAAALAM